MIAYGQVKGRRYDNRQKLPEVKKEEVFIPENLRNAPVVCDGELFKSRHAVAVYLGCQQDTITRHLESGRPYKGHILTYLIPRGNDEK